MGVWILLSPCSTVRWTAACCSLPHYGWTTRCGLFSEGLSRRTCCSWQQTQVLVHGESLQVLSILPCDILNVLPYTLYTQYFHYVCHHCLNTLGCTHGCYSCSESYIFQSTKLSRYVAMLLTCSAPVSFITSLNRYKAWHCHSQLPEIHRYTGKVTKSIHL